MALLRKDLTQTTAIPADASGNPVLCVDLDGTLIDGDMFYESLLLLAKQRPLALLLVPFWLLFGRVVLKRRIAERVQLDPKCLLYNRRVLEYLQQEKHTGRTIVLATASDATFAEAIAQHLGLFDLVLASDGVTNLKGSNKRVVLERHFGVNGFDYVGDSKADLAVWSSAANGVVVARSRTIARKAAAVVNVKKTIEVPQPQRGKSLLRALRLHHWSKNILLFLPLILAHKVKDLHRLLEAALAFFCFGGCASAIYVLNDLSDLHSDRQHPWKSRRPFASSALSIPVGVFLFCALALCSLTASWFLLSHEFTAVLASYLLLSILYSTSLKSVLLVDILLLTSFYGLRILGGAAAVHVKISYWLIAFAMFFFYSLAMAKRYSELVHASELIESGNSGRAYLLDDRTALSVFGIASGYISVLVVAFYINSHEVMSLYRRPEVLWLICPLILYWVSRIWILAHRSLLADDPVVIAIRDKVSYVTAVLAIAIILGAGPMS